MKLTEARLKKLLRWEESFRKTTDKEERIKIEVKERLTILPEDLKELFSKNPPKVLMIVEHLALRLRHLTNDYAAVCRQICEKS